MAIWGNLAGTFKNLFSVGKPAGTHYIEKSGDDLRFKDPNNIVKTLTQLAAAGAGDVVGPASATDNALARYHLTTGKIIQNGPVTQDDDGRLKLVKTISAKELNDIGNSGAAFTFYLRDGNHQKVTLTADSVALTIDDTDITGPWKGTLDVYQDATGGRVITSAVISGAKVYTINGNDLDFPPSAAAYNKLIIDFDGTDVVLSTTCELKEWT